MRLRKRFPNWLLSPSTARIDIITWDAWRTNIVLKKPFHLLSLDEWSKLPPYRCQPCIYGFFDNNDPVYFGKANCITKRVASWKTADYKTDLQDPKTGIIAHVKMVFTHMKCLPVDNKTEKELLDLEDEYIDFYDPKYNTQKKKKYQARWVTDPLTKKAIRIKKCQECKADKEDLNFCLDVSSDDDLNRICKVCARVYYDTRKKEEQESFGQMKLFD